MIKELDIRGAIEEFISENPEKVNASSPCIGCPEWGDCDGAPLDDEGEGVYCRARIFGNF